jgi:hypothetical protein
MQHSSITLFGLADFRPVNKLVLQLLPQITLCPKCFQHLVRLVKV